MFERTETTIPGVAIIKPSVFGDDRGFFLETYHAVKFGELGIHDTFVQDNHSYSRRGTLRGLHYQLKRAQAKLCRVVRGEVLDIAVDIRRGSPTFGKWASAILSAQNKHQIYIPRGFAHAFMALSEEAEFLYKCSDFYDATSEHGIVWNDPQLAIQWDVAEPILSTKDSQYPRLAEISPELLPVYNV